MKIAAVVLCFLAGFLATSAQAESTVLDVVKSNPNLSTLLSAIQAAGIEESLNQKDITLFAPSNDAFVNDPKLPGYRLKYLLDPKNKESLVRVLSYHVAVSVESSKDLITKASSSMGVSTAEGTNKLFPTYENNQLQIDDETCHAAAITTEDVAASNGMVQIIDSVLIPPGAICPDVVFAAEQRSDARISVYGYDCRNRGFQHLLHGEAKPVGLAVDSASQTLFWSNDLDEPHQTNTSWITSMNWTNVSTLTKIRKKAVDPQGMETDEARERLYFTEHSGYRVSSSKYDGSDYTVLVEKKGDDCFQTSDVSVDIDANKMFIYAECPTTDAGTLWVANATGGNLTKLKDGLLHNYGLCIDRNQKHLFYVQGGNDGSITCHAYGKIPCAKDVVIDGLQWPYMCQVDSTWVEYGGPTIVIFSEANRPGTISYLTTNGTDLQSLKVLTSELDAPMGVALGCLGTDANMNVTALL